MQLIWKSHALVTLQLLALLLGDRVPILFRINLASLFGRRLAKVSDGCDAENSGLATEDMGLIGDVSGLTGK
jgi:hypothetical protein